ncbi:MAG TPA: alkaline phosphatase D family protein [Tepidisphaeraceae bacterium]|nr:alkaline phosphatase D family protein [Tepidisphaeraceae bacterium]
MRSKFIGFCLVAGLLSVVGCAPKPAQTRIAFGSCSDQAKPQPVLKLVVQRRPDVFIYLGDNIYGDSEDPAELKAKYAQLAARPEFVELKRHVPLLATWDDHDYGMNDAGREYVSKAESKSLLLDFFDVPRESERRRHEGVYGSEIIRAGKRSVQIILLDCRTFRDSLSRFTQDMKRPAGFFYDPDYVPHSHSGSTLLGEVQWQWLERQLRQPADVRIVASGTQLGISYNGYEAWANFPHEQQRMFDLIRRTRAAGVVFISGDVHYAEISRLEPDGLYPLHDITSSGLTQTWDFATPNTNRIEGPVMDNNFGQITIDWQRDPVIRMEIIDVRGNQRIEHSVRLSSLMPK